MMPLNIVIIGAGLGGLAAALSIKQESPHHDVLVVESAPMLAEIGAGLQLTPNATRLLLRWGLKSRLEPLASSPEEFVVRRYDGKKLLGERQGFAAEMFDKFGSYYWDMHRADLQLAMYERAVSLGIRFQFGVLITEINGYLPELTSDKGESFTGDLVIAADGLWSKARSAVSGHPTPPLPTGDLAYRIVLEAKDLKDQELLDFTRKSRVCLWVGPGCHAIYYPLRNNSMINIVLLVPDNLPDNVAKMPGSISEMKEIFKSWDPLLRKLLDQVDGVEKWKLMHLHEMEKWYNEDATVVFLGDACHPMLPYMAQGAGSALEDVTTGIGDISELESTSKYCITEMEPETGKITNIHGRVQKTYTPSQRHVNHLPDGREQEERDRLAASQIHDQQPGYPFYWIDPAAQQFTYGYDVITEVSLRGLLIS
ncbi:hypothetical protein N7499_004981 [Penicillium canescens]|nr:hypothetical protein N7499_004981 [Penicillium canescens]